MSRKPNKFVNAIPVILFLLLLVLNWWSISSFRYTVVSWGTFIGVSLIGTAILSIPVALLASKLQKDLSKLSIVLRSVVVSTLLYFLLLSCVPFLINALTISDTKHERLPIGGVSESIREYEDEYDNLNYDITYDNGFVYKGIKFTKNSSYDDATEASFDVGAGCFGWEYLSDVQVN